MKTTRNTISKIAILELITSSEVALSHIEIQNILNGLCDRVTIYRVLDRLVNEDLVHKIVTPEGTIKYASCNHKHENHSHSHQHIHFNCEKCLAVTCLENIEPVFKIPENYKVKEMNFTLTGICPNCN
ncbi:Fur family transcriptional regulator [Flavobacterium sp.]|uniref:Fur family transcriptional regulator n=1 Tax=Flavobacterium sp. TaxID=239 RepID=UPI00286AE80B|nr:Fur family transcriptional regulator [Flavobacterium sp.]